MRRVVVKFIDSKDYSVIPTNWSVETDTGNLSVCSVKFCKWPSKKVNSDDLQLADDPDGSRDRYKIKVLGGNKAYGKKTQFSLIRYKYDIILLLSRLVGI